MRERVLVWGSGAIGGSVGAWLGKAGHDVTFVDASHQHVSAIRQNGLRITGPVDRFTVAAPAFTPEMVVGEWPIILLAVKAQHTEEACRQLLPHLDGRGSVVSMQNGLCEPLIAGIVGGERTIGALIGFMADRTGPGIIRFGKRAKFCIGELDGSMGARVQALGRLMRDFEPSVEITPTIWRYLWGKLGFTGLLYGTALGVSTLVELFSDERLLPAWRAIGEEIVTVAAAAEVVPLGFDGFEPAAFASGVPMENTAASMKAMADFLRGSPKTHSGMWRDIAIHKRLTEVDQQLGMVINIARKHAVEVPILSRLVELVHAVERHDLPQSDSLIHGLAIEAARLAEMTS